MATRPYNKGDPSLSVDERRKLVYRRYHLKKSYGISVEQYRAMVEAVNNTCPLCGKRGGPGTKS